MIGFMPTLTARHTNITMWTQANDGWLFLLQQIWLLCFVLFILLLIVFRFYLMTHDFASSAAGNLESKWVDLCSNEFYGKYICFHLKIFKAKCIELFNISMPKFGLVKCSLCDVLLYTIMYWFIEIKELCLIL